MKPPDLTCRIPDDGPFGPPVIILVIFGLLVLCLAYLGQAVPLLIAIATTVVAAFTDRFVRTWLT